MEFCKKCKERIGFGESFLFDHGKTVHLDCIFQKRERKQNQMTYERREQIFSKESLSISDLEELFDISYSSAQNLMQNIRLKANRTDFIIGHCLIDDYLNFFNIQDRSRYVRKLTDKDNDRGFYPKKDDLAKHYSVCVGQ